MPTAINEIAAAANAFSEALKKHNVTGGCFAEAHLKEGIGTVAACNDPSDNKNTFAVDALVGILSTMIKDRKDFAQKIVSKTN